MRRGGASKRRGADGALDRDHAALATLFRALASASLVAGCSTSPAAPPATDATLDVAADATLDAGDASDADETQSAEAAVDEGLDTYDPGLVDACAPTPSDSGNLEETSALCTRYYDLPCALPPDITPLGGCRIDVNDCVKLCHYDATACTIVGDGCIDGTYVSVVGPITVYCDLCGAAGRRPRGFRSRRVDGASRDLGRYFASMATLEAASVPAFREVVAELRAHAASRPLVSAAARAMRDEVRHARATSRLARRFGAHPIAPVVRRPRRRDLEAFALDNEIEGCVRETFAALIVTAQAQRARDRDVAATLRGIAFDETRHAALARAISRWARAKLSRAANARLDRAREAALDALVRQLGAPSAPIASIAGVPDLATQRALLAAMRARLFQSPKPTTDRTQNRDSPVPSGDGATSLTR